MLEDNERMLLLRYLVDGLKGQESVIASDVWHIASGVNIVLCSDSYSATACLQCGNELVGLGLIYTTQLGYLVPFKVYMMDGI